MAINRLCGLAETFPFSYSGGNGEPTTTVYADADNWNGLVDWNVDSTIVRVVSQRLDVSPATHCSNCATLVRFVVVSAFTYEYYIFRHLLPLINYNEETDRAETQNVTTSVTENRPDIFL